MIAEFMDGLDNSTKDTLMNRLKEAKEFGRQNPLESLDPSIIADRHCVPYTGVFGDKEVKRFIFEYKDRYAIRGRFLNLISAF